MNRKSFTHSAVSSNLPGNLSGLDRDIHSSFLSLMASSLFVIQVNLDTSGTVRPSDG